MRRTVIAVVGSALLGCGDQGPLDVTDGCLFQMCVASRPGANTLSWSAPDLWFGVDPDTGQLETRELTLHNRGFYPVKVEAQVDGPFRLEPASARVPPQGDARFVVHFEGEGLGVATGSIVLPLQGVGGVVNLYGEGTLAEQVNTRCETVKACHLAARDEDTGECRRLPQSGRTCETVCGEAGVCTEGLCLTPTPPLAPVWTWEPARRAVYFRGVVDPHGNLYLTECDVHSASQTSCDLVSLRPDGSLRLRAEPPLLSGSAPLQAVAWVDGRVLLQSEEQLVAVDGETGAQAWTLDAPGIEAHAIDRTAGRILYSAQSEEDGGSALYEVDLATGTRLHRGGGAQALALDERGNLYLERGTVAADGTQRSVLTSLGPDFVQRWTAEAPAATGHLAAAGPVVVSRGGSAFDAFTGSALPVPAQPNRLWNDRVAVAAGGAVAEAVAARAASAALTEEGTLLITRTHPPKHDLPPPPWEHPVADHCVGQWDPQGERLQGRRLLPDDRYAAHEHPGALVSGRVLLVEAALNHRPNRLYAFDVPGAPALAARGWVTARGDAQGSHAPLP